MTYEEALSHCRSSFRDKLVHSVTLLRKAERIALAYDSKDGFYLAFSGGKDSQALYHVAQLAGVKFQAHFSPTSVDPPAVIRFIRTQYPDVHFERLTRSIYTEAIKKGILPTKRVRWCCNEFKENAGSGKVTLIGIRKKESARRAKRNEVEVSTRAESRKFSGDMEGFEQYRKEQLAKLKPSLANTDAINNETITGCIHGKDSLLVSPIIHWTEEDVWYFLNEVLQVPHCSLYDEGWKRLGCICCPMSSNRQKRKELARYPHVREKWIKTIMSIRNGGGISHNQYEELSSKHPDGAYIAHPDPQYWGGQNYLDATYPFSECPSSNSVTKDKEREIAENIFDWWISGKGYKKWYADKFLSLHFTFQD